jgi:8-oxo-dGTP pyrophosphatase MutT (NUDIX family)
MSDTLEILEGETATACTVKQNICRNCGAIGHLYKYCKNPIMSFGLICYRKNDYIDNYEYLMIQRRNSLSFVEFIRGKYELSDIVYIKNLMIYMTVYERNILKLKPFDILWNEVWYQAFTQKQLMSDYNSAKVKFEKLCSGFPKTKDISYYSLYTLLADTSTKYYEPEWGFPKGRRRLKEKDVDCAIREFCEETGLTKNEIKLDNELDVHEEIFYGTNNVLYRHVYYIAKIVKNVYKPMYINYCNPHQAREVQKVKWFSKKDVLKRIREYNPERKEVFLNAVKTIEEIQ